MKIKTEREISLVDLMKEKMGGSITKIKKKIKQQEVFVNGELITGHNPQIPAQSVVEFRETKRLLSMNIPILFEDSDLIAVEKPTGLLSSQSLKDKDGTVLGKVNQYLSHKTHNKERAFVVHRLDQKVSGVILFAKSYRIEQELSKNWTKFEKTYHAAVEGHPAKDSGTLESWLYEDRNYKVHSSIEQRADSKLAITHYEIEKKFRRHSLLSIKLGTGKKNQIRVHLADLGCPIIGDDKYGSNSNPIGRIGLHAHTLSILHPVSGKALTLHSPSPKSFFNLP